MTTVLTGIGVTLRALSVQGVATELGVRAVDALLTRRAVGTRVWRNGLATVLLIMILWMGHLAQMTVLASVFVTVGEFETFAPAFYHSAVNCTTLGYGDIVVSPVRFLARVEMAGAEIVNCPEYVRRWIAAENGGR